MLGQLHFPKKKNEIGPLPKTVLKHQARPLCPATSAPPPWMPAVGNLSGQPGSPRSWAGPAPGTGYADARGIHRRRHAHSAGVRARGSEAARTLCLGPPRGLQGCSSAINKAFIFNVKKKKSIPSVPEREGQVYKTFRR